MQIVRDTERDNNFNLIRMVAAFAVLVSHSFALVLGMDAQPGIHGIRLGAFAVDVFFVTSGYLVTASLLRRSFLEFTAARMLRIYPALIVVCALTVLWCASLSTSADYWKAVPNYFVRNAFLIPGASNELPGVFAGNPVHGINGSLWTLPYEVKMYAALATVWLIVARRPVWFRVATAVIAAAAFIISITRPSILAHLCFMFFAGAGLYMLREKVAMTWPVAAAAFAVLALSAVDPRAFATCYLLTLPYLVLALAFLPRGALAYNSVGDYSYGVYIYAFPVQQSVIAFGVTSVLGVFVISAAVTLVFAVLSWHLIEKRALALKGWLKRRASKPAPVIA